MMDETTITSNKAAIKNNDKIKISLVIAERKYYFRIKKEEEEVCRKATKMIRTKVLAIKEKSVNANRDAQDILAIAALQFVIELINEKEKNDEQSIQNKLFELNADIENYLQIQEKKQNDL